MFFHDLQQFINDNQYLPESILFYNQNSISINQYENLAKYIKHIFIIQTNSFSYKSLYLKLRYYKNIHFLLSTNIYDFRYDIICSSYSDQMLEDYLCNSASYKYFHIINEDPQYSNLIRCRNSFYKNLLVVQNNQQVSQNEDLSQIQQQNLNDNQNQLFRDSSNSYNKLLIQSYNKSNIKNISIIIPTFNQSEYTIKCFKSIDKYCDQSYQIKIYWIDNGSSSKQIGNVRRCVKKLKNIEVIELFSKQQLGFIKATNFGIAEALKQNPDYIILQNNDTEVTENWLQPMIKALQSDNKILAAGPMTNSKLAVQGFENIHNNVIKDLFSFEQKSINQIVEKLHQQYKNKYILINEQNKKFIPSFFCSILKTEAFRYLGLINTDFGIGYGDDVDFYQKLFQNNFSFAFVPESYVLHNHRTTFSSILTEEEIKSTIKAKLKQIQISNQLNKDHKKKYVIYTCITGNYDQLRKLDFIDEENFDYICFTNSSNINVQSPWKIININEFSKYLKQIDNTRLARFFKLHPHLFFKNYQYSIWIDGNINLIQSPEQLINQFSINDFIFISQHPLRDCVYQEILACLKLNKDNQQIINQQKEFLLNQNYPEHNGMVQSGFMIRKHNNQICKSLMQQWWNIIKTKSKRDQLSFNYVMWKNSASYLYLPWNQINQKYLLLGYKHQR